MHYPICGQNSICGQNPICGQIPVYGQNSICGQNLFCGQDPICRQNPFNGPPISGRFFGAMKNLHIGGSLGHLMIKNYLQKSLLDLFVSAKKCLKRLKNEISFI